MNQVLAANRGDPDAEEAARDGAARVRDVPRAPTLVRVRVLPAPAELTRFGSTLRTRARISMTATVGAARRRYGSGGTLCAASGLGDLPIRIAPKRSWVHRGRCGLRQPTPRACAPVRLGLRSVVETSP